MIRGSSFAGGGGGGYMFLWKKTTLAQGFFKNIPLPSWLLKEILQPLILTMHNEKKLAQCRFKDIFKLLAASVKGEEGTSKIPKARIKREEYASTFQRYKKPFLVLCTFNYFQWNINTNTFNKLWYLNDSNADSFLDKFVQSSNLNS